MTPWFTLDRIDNETFILSEYRHWEETHCYPGGRALEYLVLLDVEVLRRVAAVQDHLTDRFPAQREFPVQPANRIGSMRKGGPL